MIEDSNNETKADSAHDVGFAIDDLMCAFQAYKETNDEMLGQIERRSSSKPRLTACAFCSMNCRGSSSSSSSMSSMQAE